MRLVRTPIGVRDAVGINLIWIVVLDGALGCGKTGKGSEADGEGGTHVDEVVRFDGEV